VSRGFDYVTVGHVTVDEMSTDGSRRPGGGAFYSALQAARLGLKTLIVTKGIPGEIEELLAPYRDELELLVHPAEHTTVLATTVGAGAERRQRVLAWAGAIDEPLDVDTAILHLAPVAREIPSGWPSSTHGRVGSAEFVGITPQGLVRQWDTGGEMSLHPLDPTTVPAHLDAAVVSEAELACCEWLSARTLLAVTAGARPTQVHLPDGAVHGVDVPSVGSPLDDLGAGDVFAAAFFIALHEGRPPLDAATFGNAAAAVRVAGMGAQAIGGKAAVTDASR
jgi:pfkB family carbohydrate kinase